MHSLSLRFWDDARSSSSVRGAPTLLLVLVFVLASARRFVNWLLAPLRNFGILEEASHQYPPEEPLTLWPLAPLNASTTHHSSVGHNSRLIFSTVSSPGDIPLHILREKLPAVAEYGSLRADGHEDITCAVCLTDFQATDRIRRVAKCGHVFHMECLDKWIGYQRCTCPLCRSPTF